MVFIDQDANQLDEARLSTGSFWWTKNTAPLAVTHVFGCLKASFEHTPSCTEKWYKQTWPPGARGIPPQCQPYPMSAQPCTVSTLKPLQNESNKQILYTSPLASSACVWQEIDIPCHWQNNQGRMHLGRRLGIWNSRQFHSELLVKIQGTAKGNKQNTDYFQLRYTSVDARDETFSTTFQGEQPHLLGEPLILLGKPQVIFLGGNCRYIKLCNVRNRQLGGILPSSFSSFCYQKVPRVLK